MREDPPPAPIYHPWRALRERWAHVDVEHTDDIPDGRLADTNGVDEIRMRRRLLQVDRRCALAHELVHLEHGDGGTCSPEVEAEVTLEAARRLIPWDRLLAAVRWARGEQELADELWVTVPLLRARTGALHADDLLAIARVFHDANHVMPPEDHP